jgi:hypothetical protein
MLRERCEGYKVWTCVPDADTWKIHMEYVN